MGVDAVMGYASNNQTMKSKVHAFREKAEKAKLKAAVTSELIAKKLFEDAAQQWDDLADKLEKYGRPY